MGTHKIYSGIQGKEITYQGVYMETAMNYLPSNQTSSVRNLLYVCQMKCPDRSPGEQMRFLSMVDWVEYKPFGAKKERL